MPVVMICTNLIYITIEIYVIVFIGVVKVINISYMLPKNLTIIIKHQVL